MRVLALLGFTLFLLNCQTSPTGRRQLALMPEGQLQAMGAQAFEDMKRRIPVEREATVNAYVKCVAGEIIQATPSKQNWEVVVFREKSPNAFALPGGKIGVHTGMLDVAKSADQLAAVLGHEVAHVLAEHSNERVSEQMAAQGGLAVASVIMGEKQGTKYGLLMAALGAGAQFGILLPHSRAQESEADVLGLEYMAMAGFDPRESVELWRNMEKAGGGQPPEFMSTHPSHGTRIRNLNSNMNKALGILAQSGRKPTCTR